MKYAIWKNEDETEWGLHEAGKPLPNDGNDVDGRPMRLAKEFEAKGWKEAKKVYFRFIFGEGRQVS